MRPPQLDEFFPAGEGPLRAAEFAGAGVDGGYGLGRLSDGGRATPG